MPFRPRVVLAVPDVTESRMLAAWLDAEGLEPVQRSTAKAAADELRSQPFDLLIADAMFIASNLKTAGRARHSETPAIIMGDSSWSPKFPSGGQDMFLERPTDRATFVCTVTMALMDGRPERRSPRRAVNPFSATVNGVPSHIIDVSKEGMRLEMPRDRRLVTPQFILRVPLVGVSLTVQRMWMLTSRNNSDDDVMWCGGALGGISPAAEQAWRLFIETLPDAGSDTHTLSIE